jgi:hypothetical protein
MIGNKQQGSVMSNKKLAILGLVAAGMVLWAIVQSNISNRPAGGVAPGATLLQGFDPAAIGSIVLQVGGNTVTLARQGGSFVVLEKDKYPAKTSQINNLITSCLDIRTAELITRDKANFAELGVSDDKPNKTVTFLKPDKGMIAGILIGKAGADVPGTYVRLASSDRVYLSTNEPPLFPAAMDYVDRGLTEVKREDIVMVRGEGPDGSYVIMNEPDRGAVLANIPAGKRAKINWVDQVFTALTKLTFDDVKKDSGNLKFDKTYVCQLKDSTVYTISLKSQGEKTYAKCAADFMDKSAVVKKSTVESDAELKAKEAKLLARDKALDFVKKTQGWIYEIPQPTAKSLTIKFADLIEDESAGPLDAKGMKK